MSALVRLSEVPQTFLDRESWEQVRAFAPTDLLALTYLNAPYPDPAYPQGFFWTHDGSFDEARRCYEIGRELLDQCRRLLIERKLVAFGNRPDGYCEMIRPSEWTNVWPTFAINCATGPIVSFYHVEVLESIPLETPDLTMLLNCIQWLQAQDSTDPRNKRTWLQHQARSELGANLTHTMFDAAYKAVFGHSRGRPRKSTPPAKF
jgi:hypothetical protein